jgi:hypothetical protein
MATWSEIDADRAFTRAARARRRASLSCRLRGGRGVCGRLAVHDPHVAAHGSAAAASGPREIPLEAIRGTIEPNRAAQFDGEFRPAAPTRARWQSVWMAEHRGVRLPPISVVQVGDAYAIRDGHHRVSVARARGAVSIDAIVAAA